MTEERAREILGEDGRKEFEEHAFAQRFLRSIKRNQHPPIGPSGALDYVSVGCPTKAEFIARTPDGNHYVDPTLDAMWWAWRKAIAFWMRRKPGA